MVRIITMAIACVVITIQAGAQSLAVNTDGSTANASALLDVKSTAKGVLIPRMSKAQKNAIASPATGLLIFQDTPDSIGFYYYAGSSWLWLSSNLTGWSTTGNSGTDTAVNFIGTTSNMPIRFKQNNGWIGQFDRTKQNYFIGSGAGQKNINGFENIGIGDSALYNLSSAGINIGIGSYALYAERSGYYNIGIGANALFKDTSGYSNIAIGSSPGMITGKVHTT
ncbi:MAG: hypothetical protein IPI66_05985 [Chitinophagaceae bacterium]|nr:hypothetical protein [Chitinophagaceae bacterium]